MGGTRNDGRRGPGWTDLMAAKPNPGDAALDDMRAEIATLRETVAAQAAPATQEALDALEARLLERIDRLPDASAAQAGRLAAAAERIEARGGADGDRLAAIGETVSREHAMTRAGVTGIADVADVIAEDVIGLRRDLENRIQTVLGRLPVPDAEADDAEADEERPRRRVWFVLWSLLLVAASMTLEAWTHHAWQFFHWLLQ